MPRTLRPDPATDMTGGTRAPRVLLVETLDAAGSDSGDAVEHRAVLQAAGARVEMVILTPTERGRSKEPEAAVNAKAVAVSFGAGREDLAALGRVALRGFDLALVAAASPRGGAAAKALTSMLPTRWWPTGLASPPGWRERLTASPDLAPARPSDEHAYPMAPAGLAWSSVAPASSARGRRTLWDGEYVLAPLPLAGDDGARVLAAFAKEAERRTSLELVVLADPQPAFERQALARGIGARVHFVGPAAREAEWAWWCHASAALIAGQPPVSGGLILRGLAAGCPLVVVSAGGPWAGVAAWLEGHGCLTWAKREALTQVLERGPSVGEALARGRTLAKSHEPHALGVRLAMALPELRLQTAGSRRTTAA